MSSKPYILTKPPKRGGTGDGEQATPLVNPTPPGRLPPDSAYVADQHGHSPLIPWPEAGGPDDVKTPYRLRKK